MSLSDFANFSTAVSGLAVTASLIYLALQTHQNAKHTKALIEQGRTNRNISMFLAQASTDLVTAYIVGNGGTPTPQAVQERQFLMQISAHLNGVEDTFHQHESGLISDPQFKGMRQRNVDIFRTDSGAREMTMRGLSRGLFSPALAEFLRGVIAESKMPAA